MTAQAYSELLNHIKQTTALQQAAGVLSWDQEVMMPKKGADARAEQMAALESALHQRRTDPRVGDWLAKLEGAALEPAGQRNVELTKRAYDRATKVPARLAEELVRVAARSQGIWAEARAANRFGDFVPSLATIIDLKREEAAAIAVEGQSHYDALLNDFEPGMTTEVLSPLLESLRPRLSALRERIAEIGMKQVQLSGTFPTDAQLRLARIMADNVGFDWEAGRLDLSTHPFSSGTGGNSRITTRVDESEPFGCLYSTQHELGHALYEQGVPTDHAFTPAGQHVSMGVHESQSRLWENQIGRSRAYAEWFYPKFNDVFGAAGISNADALYRVLNHVETDFVRTESDEVHYNLHILLRFELERDLIGGDLQVGDLEGAWNDRFQRDFGVAVPDAAHGVLQDVHWSVGLFGYFPTYSLGNIYAAQLNAKLRSDIPDLDDLVSRGDTTSILMWLREKVHRHGSLYEPAELMKRASGEAVSVNPLLDYLDEKYSALMQG